jgi:hypothetical protein
MNKKRPEFDPATELPSIDQPGGMKTAPKEIEDAAIDHEPLAEPAAPPARAKLNRVTIEVPLGDLRTSAYMSRQLHVSTMTNEQAGIWRRIYNGLLETNAKLKSGLHVRSDADAFRWLMEQVRL